MSNSAGVPATASASRGVRGSTVAAKELTPATVYKDLAIDPNEEIVDPIGRPQPLAPGPSIYELW